MISIKRVKATQGHLPKRITTTHTPAHDNKRINVDINTSIGLRSKARNGISYNRTASRFVSQDRIYNNTKPPKRTNLKLRIKQLNIPIVLDFGEAWNILKSLFHISMTVNWPRGSDRLHTKIRSRFKHFVNHSGMFTKQCPRNILKQRLGGRAINSTLCRAGAAIEKIGAGL